MPRSGSNRIPTLMRGIAKGKVADSDALRFRGSSDPGHAMAALFDVIDAIHALTVARRVRSAAARH